VRQPSAARCARTASSSTGRKIPQNPVRLKFARSTAFANRVAAANDPDIPTAVTPIFSKAVPSEKLGSGKGAREKSMPLNFNPKRFTSSSATSSRTLACFSIFAVSWLQPSSRFSAFSKACTANGAASIANANAGLSSLAYDAGKKGAPGGTLAKAVKRKLANPFDVIAADSCITRAQALTAGSTTLKLGVVISPDKKTLSVADSTAGIIE